jgi:hypothetical protein
MDTLDLPKVYELILIQQANAIMDCLTDSEKDDSWQELEIDGIHFNINFYSNEHQINNENCKFLYAYAYMIVNGETDMFKFKVLAVRPL